MQHRALAQAVAETHDLGLLGRMGFPQLRRITDSIEVGDHPPAPAQFLADALQRWHDLIPAEWIIRFDAFVQIAFQRSKVGL